MKKNKHIPFRMCCGCRNMFEKSRLIRVILKDNELLVDDERKELCRGIYLCKDKECILLAQKRKVFSNMLKAKVPDEFFEELETRIGK